MSKRNERNPGVRRVEQQSKAGAVPRYHPQFFLPESYGISRDVFSHWIRFMLGGDARCHWGSYNGMKGHIYSAQRELTPAEIEDLQRYTEQYQSNPQDYSQQIIYRDTQGDDAFTRTDRPQEYNAQAQKYPDGRYPESMGVRDTKGASSSSGAGQASYSQSFHGGQLYNDPRDVPISRQYDPSGQSMTWTGTAQSGPSVQTQSSRSGYPGSEAWNASSQGYNYPSPQAYSYSSSQAFGVYPSSQAYGVYPSSKGDYPSSKGDYPEVRSNRPHETQSGSQAVNPAPGQYPGPESMPLSPSQPMTYNTSHPNAPYVQNTYQAYGNRNDANNNPSAMDTQSSGGQASFQQFASRDGGYPSSSMMNTRSGSKVADGGIGDDGSGRNYHVGSPRNDGSGSRRIKKEQGSPPA